MIGGPAVLLRPDTLEAQRGKIKLTNEYINHPDGIIFRDVIIQALGKQYALVAVLAFDALLHGDPKTGQVGVIIASEAFLHSLGRTQTYCFSKVRGLKSAMAQNRMPV
jgi:hypothetical protein